MVDETPVTERRVLLVDDHPIVRHGLELLINQEDDLSVCGQTESAVETLDHIDEMNPDIVVVDISLRGSNGLELTKVLKESRSELPVLVLSMHDESLYAERALRSGARGYVMKQESADTLLKAIRKVLAGGVHLSERLSSNMLREFVDGNKTEGEKFGIETLSDRELEVFELIGRGQSTRKIADRLRLSVKTIETHRAHVKQKLKLDNATELVHRAFHWVETNDSAR
ncbi:MAG: response regulator transcription factor [Verrucomicrobia bacterium]|nr:response regulator transcription factor [Verrucomicrobiota bacterium]